MLAEYQKGYDVVYAQRTGRQGETAFKRLSAWVFYRVMKLIVYEGLPPDTGDFRLISRRCLDAFNAMRETHRFLRGMVSWVGFPQTAVRFVRPARVAGRTKYSLGRMLMFAWTAALSFSPIPVRLSFYLGAGLFSIGGAYATYALARVVFGLYIVPGWASLVMVNCLTAGAIMMGLGVIGEYVARIFEEVKNRPLYIVSHRTNFDGVPERLAALSRARPRAVSGLTRMTDETGIHKRETDFHDKWALETDIRSVSVREAFEAPTAMENRFLLERMGPLAGKRVLDVGAGLGESSVYFALQGAEVTTTDISPQMVELALKLGEMYGVKLQGAVSIGEDLAVPKNSYDFVYLANVIHHVHDRASLFQQVRQALKPGGRFFSIDPIAYNPAINIYRRMATEVRTEDESPLRRADLALARRYFVDVDHREFWIASLALFVKYLLIDRVHPNSDRYWKRILKETDETLGWWKPLRALDSALTRIPGLRWWSWNTVMWGTKAPDNSRAG